MNNGTPNFQQLAQEAMRRNPNMRNNQMSMSAYECLMQNDARRGEELARNYCQTLGISPEQAVAQIKQQFGPQLGFR